MTFLLFNGQLIITGLFMANMSMHCITVKVKVKKND